MAQKKFVVIGIGRFGSVIARTLMKRGAEVMVVDRNEEIINNIADLSDIGKIILIFLMYIGRLDSLALGIALSR